MLRKWQFWFQNEIVCHDQWVTDIGFVTPWVTFRYARIVYLYAAKIRVTTFWPRLRRTTFMDMLSDATV